MTKHVRSPLTVRFDPDELAAVTAAAQAAGMTRARYIREAAVLSADHLLAREQGQAPPDPRPPGYFYCVQCEWIGPRAWPGPRNCNVCDVAARWQTVPGALVDDRRRDR